MATTEWRDCGDALAWIFCVMRDVDVLRCGEQDAPYGLQVLRRRDRFNEYDPDGSEPRELGNAWRRAVHMVRGNELEAFVRLLDRSVCTHLYLCTIGQRLCAVHNVTVAARATYCMRAGENNAARDALVRCVDERLPVWRDTVSSYVILLKQLFDAISDRLPDCRCVRVDAAIACALVPCTRRADATHVRDGCNKCTAGKRAARNIRAHLAFPLRADECFMLVWRDDPAPALPLLQQPACYASERPPGELVGPRATDAIAVDVPKQQRRVLRTAARIISWQALSDRTFSALRLAHARVRRAETLPGAAVDDLREAAELEQRVQLLQRCDDIDEIRTELAKIRDRVAGTLRRLADAVH